jgi:hypothetical protein
VMYGTLTVNSPAIPESPSFLILPLFIVAAMLATILGTQAHKRNQRTGALRILNLFCTCASALHRIHHFPLGYFS